MSSETQKLNLDHVRALARETGFTEAALVELPHTHETRDAERYKSWIDAGRERNDFDRVGSRADIDKRKSAGPA